MWFLIIFLLDKTFSSDTNGYTIWQFGVDTKGTEVLFLLFDINCSKREPLPPPIHSEKSRVFRAILRVLTDQ